MPIHSLSTQDRLFFYFLSLSFFVLASKQQTQFWKVDNKEAVCRKRTENRVLKHFNGTTESITVLRLPECFFFLLFIYVTSAFFFFFFSRAITFWLLLFKTHRFIYWLCFVFLDASFIHCWATEDDLFVVAVSYIGRFTHYSILFGFLFCVLSRFLFFFFFF